MRQDTVDRFWAKVDRNGPVPAYRPDLGSCWIWTGAISQNGYGSAWHPDRARVVSAHRMAYEIVYGSVRPKSHIDHLCRVVACVNPTHLEEVTPSQNAKRGIFPNSLKTHCLRGHPLAGDNVYVIPSTGSRQCRACVRIVRAG